MMIAGVATLLVKDFDEDGIAVPTPTPSVTTTFSFTPTPTDSVEPTDEPTKTREPTTKPTRSNNPDVPDMPKSGIGGGLALGAVLMMFALGLILGRRRILV